MRKIKYGTQQLVVSAVIRDIAEEIADLTLRFEDTKSTVSEEVMKSHHRNIMKMIEARSVILQQLTETLSKEVNLN